MVDNARLWNICEDGLAAVGYDLVELEYVRDPQGWVLRLYVDHLECADGDDGPESDKRSGISLGDCEQASRHIGTILDVEDPIDTAYRLEVSSPGLRRPVRKQRDFERFVGRSLVVQMKEPVRGRKNFTGRLSAVEEGEITIETEAGEPFSLPLALMRRARLEEDQAATRTPKPARRGESSKKRKQ